MAKLCIQMCPVLTTDSIRYLNQAKIYTVLDFLQADPEILVKLSKLQYKEILQVRQYLLGNYAAFPRSGNDAYSKLVSNTALIPTGVKCMDELLKGGFVTGNIYEIFGPTGSGKTQFCITTMANIIRAFGQYIHYIDTKYDFSGKRLSSILEKHGCQYQDIGFVMERVQVTRVQGIHQLFSFLQSLKNTLHYEERNIVRLIIIDSLPALFFPFLGERHGEGLGMMNQLANTLKYLALEFHVVCLVANLAVFSMEEENHYAAEGMWTNELRPALGKFWLSVPSTRLQFSKDANEEVIVTLVKSTYLPTGKSCKFKISEAGVS